MAEQAIPAAETAEVPVEKRNILEVRDLKKYFLIRKEWKLVKERVPVSPEADGNGAEGTEGETPASSPETSPAETPAEAPKAAEAPESGDAAAAPEAAPEAAETANKSAEQAFKTKHKLEYRKTYVKAVDGVSFDVPYGETLGIVGESGCGKSTMGRSILRLHEITAGQVVFDGQDITKMKPGELRKIRPQMQIVFQDPYSSLPPRLPVGEIIGEAVKVHGIVPKSEYRDYILSIMRKCGLQDFYFDRYPHEFSGGQRQRICIARALALKPKFVVCDEPVSALDVSIQAQIVNLLKELQRDMNLTYMFISHDLSVVKHISDRVGVMYLGNFVEMGSKNAIFNSPMHPYTLALLSAVPVPDPHYEVKRIILEGDIPSPANPPKGCKFHTRCSYCMDICKEVAPKFIDYGGGHLCACHLYSQEQ